MRSSSLLEDSQHQPFTGVYDTFMLPQQRSEPRRALRLEQLCARSSASTPRPSRGQAKDYLRATPYRLEEEKMAVSSSRSWAAAHGTRFYPDFAGVARSHNFYPVAAA